MCVIERERERERDTIYIYIYIYISLYICMCIYIERELLFVGRWQPLPLHPERAPAAKRERLIDSPAECACADSRAGETFIGTFSSSLILSSLELSDTQVYEP